MLAAGACAPAPPPTLEGFDTAEIRVGDTSLTVAVADTASQRRQGLRGFEEFPTGFDGMLFIWDSPRSATFVMETVPFPLDIWWFDAEGRLVAQTHMDPCPSGPCPGYPSPGPVLWALETPAGELAFEAGSHISTGGNP